MKKIISIYLSLIICLSFCFSTAAASPSAALNSASSVTAGENIEFTVVISGCGNISSVAVDVSYDNTFEFVSGSWMKSGSLSNFDKNTMKGALGGLASPDINGNLFKLTLKAKTAGVDSQSVSINVIAKNGAVTVMDTHAAKTVRITCKTHSFGAWTTVKNAACTAKGEEKRVCSVCGYEETHTTNATGHKYGNWTTTKAATCTSAGTQDRVCSVCSGKETKSIPATGHNYGSWKVTKEATCTAAGTEARTCSKCGHSESRSIKALGHNFSSPTVTKEPTCTETGIESGTCTRCGQTTTQSIPAAGHKYGEWNEVKAPTCTEKGTEERICTVCSHKETHETEALGHDFENPVIVKEPTISSTGLMEGKCKRCGETTSEVIPCSATDKATGTVFETEEGVFEEGTQMTVEEIKQDNPVYESVKNVLSEITDTFTVYDAFAVLNGAKVQPNGEVTATFNIPEGYGTDVAVFYISDEGTYEKLESFVNEDSKTVSVKLNYFGKCAVCKIGTDTSSDADDISEPTVLSAESNNKAWIIIVIVAVVIVAGAIAGIIIYKKRKTVF